MSRPEVDGSHRIWQRWAWIGFIALVYFLAARLSLALAIPPEGFITIWLPAGIFLAGLLLSRRRQWLILVPVLGLADVLAKISAGTPLSLSLYLAAVLCAGTVLGAWLLVRFVGTPITLTSLRELLALAGLAALLSNGLAALGAAAITWLLSGQSFGAGWQLWGLAEGLGILLVSPPILTAAATWRTMGSPAWPRIVEALLLIVGAAAATTLIFNQSRVGIAILPVLYLIFPFLIWAAARFRLGLTSAAILLVALLAVWYTALGHGPIMFIDAANQQRIIWLQLYLVTVSFSALALAVLIEERRQAQLRAEQTKEQLAHILERITDGFVALDNKWRYSYVNQQGAQMLGRQPEELIGKDIWTVFPEGINRAFYQAYHQAMAEQKPVYLEEYFAPWDRWFENRIYPDPDGLSIYFQDTTERKRAETALHESQARLQLAVQAANVGLWDWDIQAQTVYYSPEWKKQIGYEEDEISNEFSQWQSRVHPDDLERTLANIQAYLKKPWPNYEVEFRLRHKDGSYRWILTHASLLLDEAGNPYRMLGSHIDITERKRAEEALRASETGFRLLFANNPLPMWVYDLETLHFLEVNEAAIAYYGYSRDEFRRMRITDIRPPEDVPRLLENIKRERPNLQHSGQWRHRLKDGRIIDVDITSHTLEFAGRKAALVVAQDITERKRAEEALRESEARFRAMADASPLGIFLTDPAGNDIYANLVNRQQMGLTFEETLGTGWQRAIHPEDRQRVFARFYAAVQNEGIYEDECRYLHSDGTVVWVRIKAAAVRDGPTLLGYVGIVEDITERRQAEAELRRRNRELALLNRVIAASATSSSEELEWVLETACHELALAFNVPQAGAILLNPDKTEAVVVAEYLAEGQPSILNSVIPVAGNPALQHLLAHKAPLVVEDAPNDPRLAVMRDLLGRLGTVSLLMVPLVVEGEMVGGIGLGAAKLRPFSNEEVDLAQSVAGQLTGVLARRQLAREHQRLAEQYHQSQKMEAIGQLTAGIAHDFNNLLTAINGFAELMQMQLQPDDSRRDMVDKILHSGRRAADLVRQLLAFSRKQIIEPKILDLDAVVAGMDGMLRRIIGEHIQIETKLASSLWPVKVDPSQIEQVVLNLAVNARDAMPHGGRLTIETANMVVDEHYAARHIEARPGEYVLLAMSDTGVGMSQEVKAHLFEPFFTTKGVGKGTGLGLATVYGIVKQNGGFIRVYSEEGRGATFKIYLPRAAEATPAAPATEGARLPSGQETILLVEDAGSVRQLARLILQEQGYTLLEAQSGEEALQLAAGYAGPIHLLLTDVVMTGMSGKALADHLTQSRPELKILFMSGYTDEAIAHHGVLEPGVVLLQKPFNARDLIRKVRAVLDRKWP